MEHVRRMMLKSLKRLDHCLNRSSIEWIEFEKNILRDEEPNVLRSQIAQRDRPMPKANQTKTFFVVARVHYSTHTRLRDSVRHHNFSIFTIKIYSKTFGRSSYASDSWRSTSGACLQFTPHRPSKSKLNETRVDRLRVRWVFFLCLFRSQFERIRCLFVLLRTIGRWKEENILTAFLLFGDAMKILCGKLSTNRLFKCAITNLDVGQTRISSQLRTVYA